MIRLLNYGILAAVDEYCHDKVKPVAAIETTQIYIFSYLFRVLYLLNHQFLGYGILFYIFTQYIIIEKSAF